VADRSMKLEELEALLAENLGRLGFACETEDRHGPMASGYVRYSSSRSDVVLDSDRGLLAITMGPPGFATFGYRPWADVLGLAVDADLDVKEQAEFLLGHAQQIESTIEHDPQIGDRLRSSNWRFVKEYLGLDPDMRRPGEAEDANP
jgi:hypothetical protein